MTSTLLDKRAITTRSTSEVWLVGHVSHTLPGTKLPTWRQVLSVFFQQHRILKKTVRDSARYTVRDVFQLWNMAHIPTTIERNAIEKLEHMFGTWSKLKKNSKRVTTTQLTNEKDFQEDIDKLFDIAHADAMTLIKIPEDRSFLTDQRTDRKGYMTGQDKVLAGKQERQEKRKMAEDKLRYLEETRKKVCGASSSSSMPMSYVMTDSSTSDDDDSDTAVELNAERCLAPNSTKKQRPTNIISPELASALDRTNVSDRDATYLLAAAAQSLGHDIGDFAINRTSIRRARIANRSETADRVKLEFSLRDVQVPLTVHWDGKILPDITGRQSVDRLPVLVSGYQVDQLLGVPKLNHGTGEETSQAVLIVLNDWGVSNRVKAMCFDTTASNTGCRAGACSLIESKLEKDLLHLACRHHIHEVILGDVFKHSFGPSSGPDIVIFKRFRENWSNMDKSNFKTGIQDPKCSEILAAHSTLRLEAIEFAMNALQSNQPRDDFRELLELSIIFLGGIPTRGIRLMAPGAMHQARWMAKILYSIKIWMFREQFRLTAREEKSLRDISLFATLLYTAAWISCPNPITAPSNDLRLLKSLLKYKEVNEVISAAATKALSRHLWYVSEEMVALAFFDPNIDHGIKRKMVMALRNPGPNEPPKRIKLPMNSIRSKDLGDFVTVNTLNFFEILELNSKFLTEVDPEQWEENEDFRKAKQCAQSLRVVNDIAERGVKLIQDFNSSITKNEEQKQYLLHVVSEHRARFPEPRKSALLVGLQQFETL